MTTKRGGANRGRAHGGASGDVVARLAAYFHRNGYVRRQNARRVEREGWYQYKKGDEVRLIARDEAELLVMRRLLREAGFRAGAPFVKASQFCQPLYGRSDVKHFLELVAAAPARRRRAPAG